MWVPQPTIFISREVILGPPILSPPLTVAPYLSHSLRWLERCHPSLPCGVNIHGASHCSRLVAGPNPARQAVFPLRAFLCAAIFGPRDSNWWLVRKYKSSRQASRFTR